MRNKKIDKFSSMRNCKTKKNNKIFRRIILQTIACITLTGGFLVVFFFFNPLFDKYKSMIENNIKYNVDIIGAIKSVLVYVHIL